jgi:AcrR family transcriptional regulator
MPATHKDRKRDQQKRDILHAARDLFLRHGAARFTMRKLAEEVGCAPGTLYLYFRDKDLLLATLVQESFDRLAEDLERPRPELNPLELLEAMMRAYIDFGLANPDDYSFAFLLQRTRGLEKERPRPHRSFGLLVAAVQNCLDRKLIQPVDVQLAAQTLWTGIHGVTSLLITIPRFPWCERGALIDRTVNTLLEGLRPSS